MLRDTLAEYDEQDIAMMTDKTLFVDYVEVWKDAARMGIETVTFEGYVQTLNTHILPYFRERQTKLRDMTTSVIQQFYAEKMENGRIRGKGGLSGNTIKHFHNIIRQVLTHALKAGLIARQPCDDVLLPKIQKYKASFYNVDELKHLLSFCDDDAPIKPIILITAYYGLRRSEVVGLKWKAIDFTNNTLRIEHVAVRGKTRIYKDKTKNLSSKRSYPLLGEIRDTLLAMKQKQAENRALLGSAYHDSDYVFVWNDGKLVDVDYPTQTLRRIILNNGLRYIRFHDLRHSCASILITLGFGLKDIQEWLGHSDITVTGNIYAHLETKRKIEMAQRFADEFALDEKVLA